MDNNKKLLLAHVGDSRAIIARKSEHGLRAFPLCRDHKLSLPDEKKRVAEAGG